jgi:hypothetical protein
MKERQYDVALSFAGEDRHYAERLAELLTAGGYSVFYDEYERAQLWSNNLYDRLSSIYKDQAAYCVMFLSEHYARAPWTNLERQSAQARVFEGYPEYILRVRLDDTKIPGILPTDAYLDLREMAIEEIYQILVEKLSDTTSQTATTDVPSSTEVESDPGEFALLDPSDGKLYFIPVQNACWDSTEISLELLPELSEDAAFLRSLRNDFPGIVPVRNIFAFALGEDAAWVSPQKIAQKLSGSQTVWEVVLKKDGSGQNDNFLGDVTFENISPDQIAEMRARRILLDEKLEELPEHFQNRTGPAGLANQATLEMFIRKGNGFQIPQSAIPFLYRSVGQTVRKFEKFARLISVLHLKLSGTVEDVLQLDLKLLNPWQLQVRFEGYLPRRAINVAPSTIQVNGICPL